MTEKITFRLVDRNRQEPLADKSLLQLPADEVVSNRLEHDAKHFVVSEELETAINTAIAVNEPLLLSGEPGTGKTQTAYYVARKLGLALEHFQVKSDSTARDLLYHFDTVRYFHDANLHKDAALDKEKYIEERPLYKILTAGEPRILLLDEIDKAPRDFPNDLLHELDQLKFTILETDKTITLAPGSRPIVFITSNSERRLPEPFLRRCVYHHIPFDKTMVMEAVQQHKQANYDNLPPAFIEMAIERFMALRDRVNRKKPATGELLVWLRVMGLNTSVYSKDLDDDLSKLPYLGTLIKDHQDLEDLKKST